jgi:PAS domain S-box-containing protein
MADNRGMLATVRAWSRLLVSSADPDTLLERACATLTDVMGCDSAWIERPDQHSGSAPADWRHDLRADGRHLGTLNVAMPATRDLDDEQREMLAELADMLATCLARAQMIEQLQTRDEWGRMVAESARDAVALLDPRGAVTFWNPAAEALFGYPASEVLGRNLHQMILPDELLDIHRDAYRRFCASGEGAAIGKILEMPGRHRDGHQVMVELSLSALERPDGWYAVGVMRDVTARKQAEAALLRSEAKWRNVLARTPQLGISLDAEARVVFVNASFLELTGWSEQEVLGRNWFDLAIPEEVREEIRGVFALAMSSADPLGYSSYENEILTRDGQRRRIAWSNVETRNVDGEVVELTCLGIDVSERQRMEDALRSSERRLRAILQTTIDGYWVVDLDGRVAEANDAFCSLVGRARDDLLGLHVSELDAIEDAADVAVKIRRIMAHGSERFETRLRSREGTMVPVEVSATYVAEGGGSIICFGRDLTERKQAEARLEMQSGLRQLLVEISSEYIGLTPPDTKVAIDRSLGKIARFVRADRAYLFEYDFTRGVMSNTHEWCAEGIEPLIDQLQDLPLSVVPEPVEAHRQGQPYFCFDVQALAPGTTRDLLESQGIRSLLTVPFMQEGQCAGIVGFDFVRERRDWGEVELNLLSIFAHILSNLRDRKLAEDRITMLARIVDMAPSSITVHDEQGRFLYANRKTFEMHDVDERQFLATNLHDIDTPESEAELDARFREIREEGEAIFEVCHFREDGATFPLEVMATSIDWYGERAILSIATDITERKQAEAVLRKFKTVFDTANFGMALAELDGTLSYVNDRYAEDHGWTAEELLGRHLSCLHSSSQMELVTTLLQKITREGGVGPIEVGHRRRDGTEFPMLMTGIAVCDDGGDPQCYAATAIDLTERKELEQRLLQAQKMDSVGRLAGGVAHDFNNMLNVILGHADLLLEELPEDTPHRHGVQEIRDAARRSADLTRQLLAFARRQAVAPQTLDLNETVTAMLKMLERLIGEHIELAWSPAPAVDPIRMDPAQVDQILANLVVNARDAIGQDVGTVSIETAGVAFDADWCASHEGYLPGRFVQLTVRDNGSGMDEATMANVFEPFFTTKAMGAGTGLGLATVYGIVKQNRGFLTVESKLGQGSAFNVFLPAHQQRTRMPAAPDAPPRPPVTGGDETILLVEDEPAILDLVRTMLTGLGYRVLTASSPEAALTTMADDTPEVQLVITDVVMPGMNGRDLVERLRRLRPNIRSLFISGYTPDQVLRHDDDGLDGHFLAKPFDLESLGTRVRRILDS